jgi:hypothetical protein
VAVEGFTVPVVEDGTYGPAGASEVAIGLSMSGGGLSLASADGGATQVPVVRAGAQSTAWWHGASGDWLAYGHMGQGTLFSAVLNWTPSTPLSDHPTLANLDSAAAGLPLSGSQNAEVTGIAGVPGQDVLLAGLARGDINGTGAGDGALVRVDLTAGATPTGTLTPLAAGHVPGAVQAVAYCPAGSAPGLSDILVAATGGGLNGQNWSDGHVLRIADPVHSNGSTVGDAAGLPGTAPVSDLRVSCSTGVVWAALGGASFNGNAPGAGLYRSTDGGQSFVKVETDPQIRAASAVGLDPSNADHVIVSDTAGFVTETTDGGTTWTTLNDPGNGGISFGGGIADIELPPAAAPLAHVAALAPVGAASLSTTSFLATSGGAFRARVGAPHGGGNPPGNPGNGNPGTTPPPSGPGAPPHVVRCVVPKLKGKTLKAAKAALKKAHCRAGKLTRVHAATKVGRVARQSRVAGKHLPVGTKVAFALSLGPVHHKPRHKHKH